MSDQDAFGSVLELLYESMLDDSRWPAASALIDEACGTVGNSVAVGEGPKDDIRIFCAGLYYRGQRRFDLEREYLEDFHPIDERVPRLRQLPDGHLARIKDLYTAEELKTSSAYNQAMVRGKFRNGLNVRLDVADGSYMTWNLGNRVGPGGWGTNEITRVTRLLPHIRQFVRVRQALVRANALDTTVTALLDNPRIGVLHLDGRGRIMAANDRAVSILRQGEELSDRDGLLRALAPDDHLRLERLLAAALPTSDTVPLSGSMLVHRPSTLLRLVVHVKPVGMAQPNYGARQVAALVLIVEPGRRHRVDPGLLGAALGLTPRESQVAAWLAEGKS